jgi:hypothetical protein
MNHQDTKAPREPIPKETDEVASKIVDAAFAVHRALGPGLLESVYEVCLLHELNKRGLKAARQVLLIDSLKKTRQVLFNDPMNQ